MQNPCQTGVVIIALIFAVTTQGFAEPTPEQRKELATIRKEVASVASLVREREYEKAEKQLEELHARAEKLIAEAQFPPTDRAVRSLQRLLTSNRKRVARALDKPDPTLISFTEEIAPIFQRACLNCHSGNNPRGKLDLSSYAMMKRGGQSGLLLIPKNPRRSRLMLILTAQNQRVRMPKNGKPLPRADLEKIYQWILEGATFDGKNEGTPLAELGKEAESEPDKPEAPPVQIAMATGDEEVSFVEDIAPTIVNLCIGCHRANNPASGLSLVTFEAMMRGGGSGRVILPGNLDGSRLWQLVGAGEQPRMPQGQARITREFHADLRTWIQEGAKFDGDDPQALLRSLVPTEEELAMERLAALSPAEFRQMREERTQDQWERILPRTPARYVSSEEFLVYGDASEERLKQVNDWAEQYIQELRSMFDIKRKPVWKGRLTIFVMKDRFGYTELNHVLHRRNTARDVHGHAHVTAGFEDAYVALEDVGDAPGSTHGGLRLNLIDHLTGAYLRQPGTNVPEWAVRGTGLALASRNLGSNSYIDNLRADAIEALQGLNKPEDVFTDGRFGPGDVGPVGYSLVSFMIKAGGASKFGRFISRLQSGSNVSAAVKAVYPPADLKALGGAFRKSLAE